MTDEQVLSIMAAVIYAAAYTTADATMSLEQAAEEASKLQGKVRAIWPQPVAYFSKLTEELAP